MTERRKRDKFEQLMLPLLPRAYSLAMFLMRNHHTAEDAGQDAYLKAFKAFHQLSSDDGVDNSKDDFRGHTRCGWFASLSDGIVRPIDLAFSLILSGPARPTIFAYLNISKVTRAHLGVAPFRHDFGRKNQYDAVSTLEFKNQ